jgi:hypothetical protein
MNENSCCGAFAFMVATNRSHAGDSLPHFGEFLFYWDRRRTANRGNDRAPWQGLK